MADRSIISRWHNIHFSGKVIICCVIFGLGLLLVGGLLMATVNDSDEPPKDDNRKTVVDEIETRPPMHYVGPLVMGIGGFTVVVGTAMCLFETNVCCKKTSDSNPLISEPDVEAAVGDSSHSSKESSGRHYKKRASPRLNKKHDKLSHKCSKHKAKKGEGSASGASAAVSINTNRSNEAHGLRESGEFLTPSNSVERDSLTVNSQVAETNMEEQLVNIDNDAFSSPLASFQESFPVELHVEKNLQKEETQKSEALENDLLGTETHVQVPQVSSDPAISQVPKGTIEEESAENKHKFLTPLNSNADAMFESTWSTSDEFTTPPATFKDSFLQASPLIDNSQDLATTQIAAVPETNMTNVSSDLMPSTTSAHFMSELNDNSVEISNEHFFSLTHDDVVSITDNEETTGNENSTNQHDFVTPKNSDVDNRLVADVNCDSESKCDQNSENDKTCEEPHT